MMRTRSISHYLLLFAPALLIATAPGCGKFRRGAGVPPAVLVFTNESLDQADVFVVGSGLPARRIGTVMAGRTETLKVPPDLATRGNLNIVARLLARSIRPQTGFVPIAPGEQYEVRLPPDERLLVFLPSRG